MRRSVFLLGLGLALIGVAGGLVVLLISEPDVYAVEGRIAGIEKGGRTLFVEHEKIPGYMPAMTMPLPVADPVQSTSLEPGDAVRFRLRVARDSAWITALTTLPDSAVPRHPARTSQPMPGSTDKERRTLQEGDRVPADLALTNQSGTSIRLGDFRGQVLVLTFIYTRCPLPNYCPLMSKRFAALQPTLRKQFGTQVHLLSVSFDPAHDTPTVLRNYAAKYTDQMDTWTFATGDSTEIRRITDLFGVFTRREGGEITHNLVTAVIGPAGTVQRRFQGNDWTPDDVMEAVQGILDEKDTRRR